MTLHVFMFISAIRAWRRHVVRFKLPVLLFAVSVFWPLSGNADEQQAKPVYRVAIDREYAPFEFVDMHGKVQGYTPSLLRALGDEAGVQFEFIAMNWPDALASLKAGKVDIVNMIVTPERAAEFQFSAPHSRIAQALFRNEKKKNIVDLDSLAGHVVALQKGDISLDRLADRADFTRHIVDSKIEGLLHLNLGKADAFLCAQQSCVRAISEYGLLNVELAAGDLFSQDYAFATRQGNQPLIELLNRQLARIKASGQLQELEAEWLHGQLIQPSWLYQNRVVLSLLACTLLAGMVLLWNVSLRRLVHARTKSLQKNKRYLMQSQRIAHIGSWTYDMEHNITWSDEMHRIFGVSPDTFTLNAETFVNLIHTDDQAAMQSWVACCMSGGKPPALVFRCVWPDGAVHYIEGQGELLLNDNGTPFIMSGTGQDITERKETEKRLSDSMRQLESKELAKTRFLASAGHDLRQPLAAANMFLFALRSTATSPQQAEIIQQMTHSMDAFKSLLDALLKVSKLDSGMIKPECQEINVNEILIWLEQNFAVMATEKRLGFRLYFPMKEALFVRSDMGLLKSVLSNLVSNAVKFTDRGAIMISARARGGDVLFQVWDTGMGIPGEHLEHIFDEFYQLDNPQRDRTSGLGLGLAIVKRTLALLGGEVSCLSRPGRGTVFAFCLPRAVSSTVVSRAPAALPECELSDVFAQGRTFVVLEDDPLVASATTTVLEGMGGKVKCFSSAEDALLHTDIEQADYYIVDFMLGGALNGIQFLKTLRQKSGPPIKAVLVTGDTSSSFIHESAGLDWPVQYKPVDVKELFASLSAQGDWPT
ncbi:MAG: transporter substrate-binding domain-containing protein [Gallionella sp.]|nr:transporter substrate-binding domain-containing protein [Gallionella sp.]